MSESFVQNLSEMRKSVWKLTVQNKTSEFFFGNIDGKQYKFITWKVILVATVYVYPVADKQLLLILAKGISKLQL